MKVTIHGAGGGEVTGSAYMVQTREANVLVDLGLFQGARKVENYNNIPKRGAFDKLNAVVLTHAHLDHTGRLPLLVRAGYQGPIHATPATIDIAELILKDSAFLQQGDVERQNRRRQREGKPLLEPLYTKDDVDRLKPLYRPLAYDQPTQLAPGISVRAVEAGHMLGSVSIEMTVEEEGRKQVVVFSGDLGPRGAPLHRDPVPFKHADVVFMESTYGDRDHRSLMETAVETRKVVKQAIDAGGKILVPTFAVGRTQLLLYLLAGAFQRALAVPELHRQPDGDRGHQGLPAAYGAVRRGGARDAAIGRAATATRNGRVLADRPGLACTQRPPASGCSHARSWPAGTSACWRCRSRPPLLEQCSAA